MSCFLAWRPARRLAKGQVELVNLDALIGQILHDERQYVGVVADDLAVLDVFEQGVARLGRDDDLLLLLDVVEEPGAAVGRDQPDGGEAPRRAMAVRAQVLSVQVAVGLLSRMSGTPPRRRASW
jgi:hypothetical protein